MCEFEHFSISFAVSIVLACENNSTSLSRFIITYVMSHTVGGRNRHDVVKIVVPLLSTIP